MRGLSATAAETTERLLSEPFIQRLIAEGDVVETSLLPHDDPAVSQMVEMGWAAAVEHEPLEFITWPYEWPFSMLKDAALLQLRILDTAARNGWILKDATPFNIQWRQARPVFIDTPSFVPWDGGEYWQGYRQFCSTFLVMDLANLSPGQGWAGQERAAFDRRGSPDMVLSLALLHHMRVSANIPLSLFMEWLRGLDAAVIVEFVGRDDEMFRKLISAKSEDYPDYTEENFRREVDKRFTVRDKSQLKDGNREILLLEPKGLA